MTVNNYIETLLEKNEEDQQIVVIYDDNHNIYYIGKVAYAPLNCWFTFKNAHMVGNELRINDEERESEEAEIIDVLESIKNNKWINEYKCYCGYYPVEILDKALENIYSNDFDSRSQLVSFINNAVWRNLIKKGFVKISKRGGTFKILV